MDYNKSMSDDSFTFLQYKNNVAGCIFIILSGLIIATFGILYVRELTGVIYCIVMFIASFPLSWYMFILSGTQVTIDFENIIITDKISKNSAMLAWKDVAEIYRVYDKSGTPYLLLSKRKLDDKEVKKDAKKIVLGIKKGKAILSYDECLCVRINVYEKDVSKFIPATLEIKERGRFVF